MNKWWQGAVIYQIYVRSFADSNGDGKGDIPGIISKLGYLKWLGVDAIWLSPIHPSPNRDWGYDVADYYGVHPDYGTLNDLKLLIKKADESGIKVVMDLVPNHTSDQHSWFNDPDKRDWYVWTGKPNNWRSFFGGSAWTKDAKSGQYYLHNFTRQQPDLNWWNPKVRQEFEQIIKYWFDLGVAGFRIDVANALIKDKALRDNPIARSGPISERLRRQKFVYNVNRPEVHEIYRDWSKIADSYQPSRLLLGETNVYEPRELAKYYGKGDELDLAFNFLFWGAKLGRPVLNVVKNTEEAFGSQRWPVWAASNHDHPGRLATRWAKGDVRKIRLALFLLMTLRGTAVLYYGDEIGLPNVKVPRSKLKDPVGIKYWPMPVGRDKARTPMQWTGEKGRGFSSGHPWLPCGPAGVNVEQQKADASSILNFTRALIVFRKSQPGLLNGGFKLVSNEPFVFKRGTLTIVMNLSGKNIPFKAGKRLFGTHEHEPTGDFLRPWEGTSF